MAFLWSQRDHDGSGPPRPQRPRVVRTVARVPSTSVADAQGLPTGAGPWISLDESLVGSQKVTVIVTVVSSDGRRLKMAPPKKMKEAYRDL